MNIIKAHAVKNLCYMASAKMVPAGIVVHSTGANNPNLKRYVDCPSEVGVNKYGNHWNQEKPGGRKVCVHAFIGYDKNGEVRVAEILPLNICCWGVASGKNGSYNYDPAYIQFEICEDGLNNADYYRKAFDVATEYAAYLCKKYNIPTFNVISHKEAHARGYGSNHSDPEHWMKKFGETMDDFRNKVSLLLKQSAKETPAPQEVTVAICNGDLVAIASNAKYYNGKTIPSWVKSQNWYVKGTPKADRVVIDENEAGTNKICSAISSKYLTVIKSASNVSKPMENSCSYLVKVRTLALNIRNGAGTNYDIVGCIRDCGVYTIVEEKLGEGATKWGKLKSGAGWISLDFVRKL